MSGSFLGTKASKKLSAPEKMSSTPVPPAWTSKCRGDAVARGHAAEVEGFFDVIGVALPGGDSGGLLRGVGKQPAHLLGVEAGGASGGGGRAEGAGDGMRAAMGVDHVLQLAQRDGDARADVVAERDRAQELRGRRC